MIGILIVIGLIWIILSIAAIYIGEQQYVWENFARYLLIITGILLVFNGYLLYDPRIVNIAVTIDMNPSFQLALIVSMVEALGIVGPMYGIYSYRKYREFKKER